MVPRITVTELWLYPIKSCAGIPVKEAHVGPRGIIHDRGWMIVRPDGMFLTQREYPRLALIVPSFDDAHLRLTAPGMIPIPIPLRGNGEHMEVVIWRDRCDGVDQGEGVASWLSQFLRTDCRLVRMADDWVRTVDQTFARPEDRVGFADAFPLLLASESSLADLNARMDVALPMNRFRPNVVITGASPFVEDTWRTIRIGDMTLRVVKPCARCVTTTVDQASGTAQGPEPLATLATYRKQNGKVMFAQNVIHDHEGLLWVGDTLKVVTTDD